MRLKVTARQDGPNLRWYQFVQEPRHLREQQFWVLAIDTTDGTVYGTWGLVSTRAIDVLLLAAIDGIEFVERDGHLYYPTDWIEKVAPDAAHSCAAIADAARRFTVEQSGKGVGV